MNITNIDNLLFINITGKTIAAGKNFFYKSLFCNELFIGYDTLIYISLLLILIYL